jgi:mannose-1-phosphate guanylyltransferase/phosphomannomutase
MAAEKRCQVIRTKSGERSMIESALSSETIMVGSMNGQLAFPSFQPAFDGMFALARIIELVAMADIPLSKIASGVPRRAFLQITIPCSWEMKGGIMRKMSEDSLDKEATFIDGIKVSFGNDWLLLLPDQYRSFIHLIAEARDTKTAQKLLDLYRGKVLSWKTELDNQ